MSGGPVTEYKTTDTSWDPTGLKIDAYYVGGTSKDVTSLVTWSYDLASPNECGEGDYCVSFAASYQGESVSDDFNVNVEAITMLDTYHLIGKQLIYEKKSENDKTCRYMNVDNATSSVYPTVVDKAHASVFKFTLVGDDTYTITDENEIKGLYHTGTKNTLSWGTSGLTYHWKIDTTPAGSLYGTYNLIGQTSDTNQRYMCIYNDTDWRTYSSATASNRTAMIQLETPKEITGFSVFSEGANKNVLKGSTFDADAAKDAGFQARLNYEDGSFDDVTETALWDLDTSSEGISVLTVTYENYDAVIFYDMNIYTATITSLSVDANIAKTDYIAGDKLNLSGLKITGNMHQTIVMI